MPGHIKKTDGPDPDPSPWLIVSPELKEKLKSKPYDPKKSCWVPEKATGGYLEGLIESTDGDKVTVQILTTKEVSSFEMVLLLYNLVIVSQTKFFMESLDIEFLPNSTRSTATKDISHNL